MAAKATQARDRATLLRLSEAELTRFKKQAAREPLATWARRILLEYVERAERRAK